MGTNTSANPGEIPVSAGGLLPWPSTDLGVGRWHVGRLIIDRSLVVAGALHLTTTAWLWWSVPVDMRSLVVFVATIVPTVLASALGHELAHAAVAQRRGYDVHQVRIGVKNFAIDWSRPSADIHPTDLVATALAGPAFNALAAAGAATLWVFGNRFDAWALLLVVVNATMVVGDIWPRRIAGDEPHPFGGTGYLTDGRLAQIGWAARQGR